MKNLIFIVLLISLQAGAQSRLEKFYETVKGFHQAMVKKDKKFIWEHTSGSLSYGHSNGWVETATEFTTNIETGFIKYHSFREDSMNAIVKNKIAHLRFVADINVTLDGKTTDYHLKVLEIWVKESKNWRLFARQAVK